MSNKQIEIYFPSNEYNEYLGDLRISKKNIEQIKHVCLKQFGKYKQKHIYIVKYENLVYEIINHNTYRYYIIESSDTYIKDDILINSYNRINTIEDEFPILNEYDEEQELNVITFNTNKININIINDSYVYVDFIDSDKINKKHINDIIQLILHLNK